MRSDRDLCFTLINVLSFNVRRQPDWKIKLCFFCVIPPNVLFFFQYQIKAHMCRPNSKMVNTWWEFDVLESGCFHLEHGTYVFYFICYIFFAGSSLISLNIILHMGISFLVLIWKKCMKYLPLRVKQPRFNQYHFLIS